MRDYLEVDHTYLMYDVEDTHCSNGNLKVDHTYLMYDAEGIG